MEENASKTAERFDKCPIWNGLPTNIGGTEKYSAAEIQPCPDGVDEADGEPTTSKLAHDWLHGEIYYNTVTNNGRGLEIIADETNESTALMD